MSRLKQNDLDAAFFTYLTDSLYYEGKGMRLTSRLYDILNPPKEIDGDEVARDIIERAGLQLNV